MNWSDCRVAAQWGREGEGGGGGDRLVWMWECVYQRIICYLCQSNGALCAHVLSPALEIGECGQGGVSECRISLGLYSRSLILSLGTGCLILV